MVSGPDGSVDGSCCGESDGAGVSGLDGSVDGLGCDESGGCVVWGSFCECPEDAAELLEEVG